MEVQCTYTHICMTRLFFTKKESEIGSDEGELAVLLPFCHIVLVKTIKGEYVKSDRKKNGTLFHSITISLYDSTLILPI